MNPIDTWIDTDEVRRLAERLISPERQPPANVREAGFNDSFVGFADATPTPADATPPTPSPATPIPKASVFVPQTAVPSISLPKQATENPQPFSADCAALADWLHQECGASAVFLINLDGNVLHDEGCAHLHFAARGMALNWKIRDAVKPVRLLVHAGSYLELIPLNHPQGRLILGIIVQHPINPTTLDHIREKSSRA